MDVAAFCSESQVLVVAGKGGVGKTTVAAALARHGRRRRAVGAARRARGPPGPGRRLRRRPARSTTRRRSCGEDGPAVASAGRWITPDDALLEYLADHGFQRVSRRLVSAGVIDVVATAIPGIRDVLVLGKVKQLERAGAADLIVVDAPATGHAVTFLTSANGLLDAARGGPVRTQAAEVLEMLDDPARCRVLLVTLPEEMPVSETVEAAYRLEDQAGVQLGPVVVNALSSRAAPGWRTPAATPPARPGSTSARRPLAALEASRRLPRRTASSCSASPGRAAGPRAPAAPAPAARPRGRRRSGRAELGHARRRPRPRAIGELVPESR